MEPLNLKMYKLPNPISMTDTTDRFEKNSRTSPGKCAALTFLLVPRCGLSFAFAFSFPTLIAR